MNLTPEEMADVYRDMRSQRDALREECKRLNRALLEANEIVCKHSLPWKWDEFQRRNGLPSADDVLRMRPAQHEGPK